MTRKQAAEQIWTILDESAEKAATPEIGKRLLEDILDVIGEFVKS